VAERRIRLTIGSKLGHPAIEGNIMDFKQIRIEKRDCGYWVAVDDTSAICLSPDEALGCVASALFGSRVIFAQTKEEQRSFLLNLRKAYGNGDFAYTEWAERLEFLGLPFEPLQKEEN
jgi:hypothetical protein